MRTITKVKYENGSINEVDGDSSWGPLKKEKVITDIDKNNINYQTKGKNGKTSDVHTVDGKYLRTDPDQTKSDNLGDLPTYD